MANNEKQKLSVVPPTYSAPKTNPTTQTQTDEDGKSIGKPEDMDMAIEQVVIEKRLALIRAWVDNEKAKADNKAYKKLSGIDAWENSKRAYVEAQMRQIEEKIEKKKAEYRDKMKNKMGIVHRAAEEKRAMVEANRGNDFLAVTEAAQKYRSTGRVPKKLFAFCN